MAARSRPTPEDRSSHPARKGLVLGLALFFVVLYAVTLCPTIYSGDAAELATAGATFGIPHPPGYPLYSLLANIWTRLLPLGQAAWRINLLSALCAAGAVVLLLGLLLRAGVVAGAAAIAALGLGLGATFWSQALVSEVYALDVLLAAAALLAAHGAGQSRQLRPLLVAALCASLWVGHRPANVILAPAALILAWPAVKFRLLHPGAPKARGPELALRRLRSGLALLGALVGPAIVYGYLPLASLRDPLLDTGDPQSWVRFWATVSAQPYRFYLQGPQASHVLDLLRGLPADLGLALVLAPLGIWAGWRAHRRLVLALLYLALANLAFVSCYRVPDAQVFTLPAALALAGLAGLGAHRVLAWLPSRWAAAALGILALVLGSLNLTANDLRGQTLVRDFAKDALSFAGKRGLVLSHVDTVSFSLWYVQAVERHRADLLVVSKGRAVDWHQEAARQRRPDLEIPLYDGPDPASRWPALLVEGNAGRVPVYVTANLQGYFAPPDAARLSGSVQELPAGLMTQLAPASRPPSPELVIRRNRTFWREAWPHAVRARAQRLETEMAALLLHYASMRLLFARYCLWHGDATEADAAARAVHQLDPAPLIATVNARYRLQGSQYHMSNMPALAATLLRLAAALRAGQLTPAAVRQQLAPRPPAAGPADVASLNDQGIRLAQANDLRGALRLFDQVLALAPEHRGALFNRAKVLAMLGQHQRAIQAYETLLRLSPHNLPALMGLAELKLPHDRPAAIRLLQRAVASPGPEQLRQAARQRLAELQSQ